VCEDRGKAQSDGGGIAMRFAADLEQSKAERFDEVVGDGARIDRCRKGRHLFLALVNSFLSLAPRW